MYAMDTAGRCAAATHRMLAAALALLTIASATRASEPDFKIGDRYTLSAERGTVAQKCEGTLVQATPRWLVLKGIVVRSTTTGVPYLMDMPGAGRLFRRNHDEKVEVYMWLLREAAIVTAHEAATAPAGGSIPESEPPLNLRCLLTTAVGGEQTKRSGKLTELAGNQLTLIADDASRQTIERQHVLCLEFQVAPVPSKAGK
jgi:hypothetical protein